MFLAKRPIDRIEVLADTPADRPQPPVARKTREVETREPRSPGERHAH